MVDFEYVIVGGGALVLAVPAVAKKRMSTLELARAIDVPFLAFVLALGLVVEAISVHGLGSVHAS